MSQFRMLLWKDYHVNRGVLLAGALLAFLPVLAFAARVFWEDQGLAQFDWRSALWIGALLSAALSPLTVAMLVSNTAAGECADRTAEFLAALPASRGLVLLSKLVFTLIGVCVLAVINLALLCGPWEFSLTWGTSRTAWSSQEAARLLSVSLAVIALVYGTGWLAGVLLRSPVIATAVAVIAPLFVAVGLQNVLGVRAQTTTGLMSLWFCRLALPLGIVQFLAAMILFLRRREP